MELIIPSLLAGGVLGFSLSQIPKSAYRWAGDFITQKTKMPLIRITGKEFYCAEVHAPIHILVQGALRSQHPSVRSSAKPLKLKQVFKDPVLVDPLLEKILPELEKEPNANDWRNSAASTLNSFHWHPESKRLTLHFSDTSELLQQANARAFQLLNPHQKESAIQKTILSQTSLFDTEFNIDASVLTSDGFILFKRKTLETSHPRPLVSAINTVVKPSGSKNSSEGPDLYKQALASLAKESGLALSSEENKALTLHSLTLNSTNYQLSLIGIVDFRKFKDPSLTASAILRRWNKSARSNRFTYEAVSFNPEAVANFISSHQDQIAYESFVTAVLSLKKEFPYQRIHNAFLPLGPLMLGAPPSIN